LHFLIVLACFRASEPGEPLSQVPLTHTQSRSSCTRCVADELTTEGCSPERDAFLKNLKNGVFRGESAFFKNPFAEKKRVNLDCYGD